MEILIATKNKGKVAEIEHILESFLGDSIKVKSLDDFPHIEEPIEDKDTFKDNAILKALYYAKATGLTALADDSGLCVDVLNGEPGIMSARYAGENASDDDNNKKLVENLKDIALEKRTARFVCAAAIANTKGETQTFEGTIGGLIIDEPRGTNGFGYDPYFYVPSLKKTTAELSKDEKSKISHRGKAFKLFSIWAKDNLQDFLT